MTTPPSQKDSKYILRDCLYCGAIVHMKPEQRFCCSKHRSAYANQQRAREVQALRNELARLKGEN